MFCLNARVKVRRLQDSCVANFRECDFNFSDHRTNFPQLRIQTEVLGSLSRL